MSAYRTNEHNDGSFDVHSAPPGETGRDVELREYIKLQAVLFRLVQIMSRVPEAAQPAAAPAQRRDDLEEEAEAEPEAPQAQEPQAPRPALVNMYVVPVCGDRDDVMPLLRANAADPAVVDYRGVHGFAWYLETREDAAHALVDAIEILIAENKQRTSAAPPRPRGRGGGAPAGAAPPSNGPGAASRARLRDSVEAMNGPAPHHDLGRNCMFHTRRGPGVTDSEDWSLTVRGVDDLAFLVSTLTRGWEPANRRPTLDDVAAVFCLRGASNWRPAFFRLPPRAALPLRLGDNCDFGMGAGLAALRVLPSAVDFNSRGRAKVTRFPLLREHSSNPALARGERVRFAFIKENPPMLNATTEEGVIRRLKLHAARTLAAGCWDLTMLAPAGTSVVYPNHGADEPQLEAPVLPEGQPEGGAPGLDGEVGWWQLVGDQPGNWELRRQYDCAGGPTSVGPTRDRPHRLRLTGCLTLRCGDEVVGAHLRVEGYGRAEQKTLPFNEAGEAVMGPGIMVDPRVNERAGRKRPASVVLAHVNANPGPVWPGRDDWAESPGTGGCQVWQPRIRLWWRNSDGKLHVVVALKVWANPQAEDTADAAEDWDARGRDAQPQPHRARRNRGPRVDIISREVQPEVWVAVPVTEGCVVVPTAHEARARMMRRLDADAEEALRCEALLPSSFVQAFAFYRETVERNQSTGRAPRGFDFVYPNLNGHMNYYAIFLLFLEYGFDVRYYHAQIFKCYMAFKHVCKTADDNVKILHTILFGPPSSGKSFAMDLCKRMTPPGIALPVTHVSDQRNAVKLGNADELSCQVQIHDEANASMLGMAEASNGRQRVAQNALSSTATEYKESLTNRRPTSCVMQVTKEGGRTRELFEWNNDIVSFQLTNNFPKLAPPMMSRFNSVCFYSIPRLDVMDSKRRAMDPARERLARGFAEHQQLLYVLQLKFDTLQACGICAPVPEEGWKVLACEFERVLRESFPFAVTETLSLDRKLSDAFQYVRMMMNTYAVYVTFAHPRAPHTDLAGVSMESFRSAERYVTPSDQTMMLALSMLEPDLFPTGEVNVLAVLCSMAEDRVRAEASLSLRPGELHPLLQPEFPLVELYADLSNYANTLADEDDDGGARPRPVHAMVVDHNPTAPVAGQPVAGRAASAPPLWRTLSAQRERMIGAIGALAGKREEFERSYLPTLEKAEFAHVLPRMQYAVAFEGSALSEDDFRERAAEEIYTRMQAKDNTSMPNDHVRSALFMLSCRSMKDADAKGATHILKSTLKVVVVEEVPQPVGTRSRVFRLVVSKTAMDELRGGGLTVKAVLEKMLHRHSLPGTYLLNAPMLVDKRTGELLPQLAQAMHVGIHKVGCRAVPGATDGAAMVAAARRAEEAAPPGVFSADRFWPWASDALVTARRCDCWRSRVISNTRGCAMPEGVRSVMGAVLGSAGAAAAHGLEESGLEAMGCPYQELGWVAHVTRLTGRSPHAMTDAELRAAGLEHAHPSSMHFVQPIAGDMRRYPYVERCDYMGASAQQRGPVTTARRDHMFSDEGGLDAMAPDIVREYEAGLRA